MLTFETIILIAGLVFAAVEVHQNTKSRYVQIYQEMQKRYDELDSDRRDFHHYYRQVQFDLKALKEESPDEYEKILTWEHRFFWFIFYEWLEGERKTVPKYMAEDWRYGIEKAMENPVHREVWKHEIRHTDFLGYQEFNQLIDSHIEEQDQ